jgi:hypothetical protein
VETDEMSRFKEIALKVSALPMDRQDVIADFVLEVFKADLRPKSLLSEAQNEELRLILSQPIEVASDEDMQAVFRDWEDCETPRK